jgi:hypothetical protein
MELDRAGAQEHRPPDLGIGPPLGDEQGDLQFLGGQLITPAELLSIPVDQDLLGGCRDLRFSRGR